MTKRRAPAYLTLGLREVARRAAAARELMRRCRLCPRACGAERLAGAPGACRVADSALIASYGPHFGEERALVGRGGSGTIFFAGCNLNCVYCQNYEISQLTQGEPVTPSQLAQMMLALQGRGCANVNFVSPSHVMPMILEGLALAVDAGFKLPLVYNTGGYDSSRSLELLDGVIDIYLPDMKYARADVGEVLSGVPEYPAVNRAAVRQMYAQVGDLALDVEGVAWRGLLVRHLVLPAGLAGTAETARWLAEEVSPNTAAINVMRQYYPCHRALAHPALNRRVTDDEWAEALQAVRRAGLRPLGG